MQDTKQKTQRSITHENELTTIEFVTYLREEFVNTMLRIKLKNSRLYSIFYHSNTYGVAEWENGAGIVQCNRWENEDQAQSQSFLSRHYTTLILNGAQDFDYAKDEIVPDVCKSFAGEYAAELAAKASTLREMNDELIHRISTPAGIPIDDKLIAKRDFA